MRVGGMNRRSFLQWMATWGAFLGSGLAVPGRVRGQAESGAAAGQSSSGSARPAVTGITSRVVAVRNPAVLLEGNRVNRRIVEQMITDGMLRLTGEDGADAAWKKLFKTGDVVGIKVNAMGGTLSATRPGVVDAIVSGLKKAGLPEENIIVWDRLTDELQKAGFVINQSGPGARCFGTDRDYDSYPETAGSIGSCFSTLVSSRCTALINVPVLKDHDLSGVSLGLKNFYGAIHNPNKYHDHNCDPYIADLNTHPYLKDKLRLTICDGLTMQYNGGPAFKPQWNEPFSTLMFGIDPVALDRIGCRLIEEKRREKGLPPLRDAGRAPVHIATAAQRGLGIDDPARIEVVSI
jgi:uncharacterized protein (DUF362 family)